MSYVYFQRIKANNIDNQYVSFSIRQIAPLDIVGLFILMRNKNKPISANPSPIKVLGTNSIKNMYLLALHVL
jgi:hypothetical protein